MCFPGFKVAIKWVNLYRYSLVQEFDRGLRPGAIFGKPPTVGRRTLTPPDP
jgi:hypothetical protein